MERSLKLKHNNTVFKINSLFLKKLYYIPNLKKYIYRSNTIRF